jgi:thiol-disulfide isomerase/thioredoxin
VEIIPAYPERGKKVTIRYNPQAPGATIPADAKEVTLVFTQSNYYEYPWKMALQKKGPFWETSFMVPTYATYATFYLQSGEAKDQPEAKNHYELALYENKKRIKSSYLQEGYSLPAQMGKGPGVEKKKAELFEKELKNYTDNYEAKLRLLSYKMSVSEGAEKEKFRKEARAVIAAKFNEKPGVMGHLNSTTMGYLIIGENSRLDSIRDIVKTRYPETEAGYSLRIGDISKMDDSVKMVNQLLGIIKKETPANSRFFTEAHELLFKIYAGRKQTEKALYHLEKLNTTFTPYTPTNLKEQAEILLNAGIALPTALKLAKHALVLADTFPAGLIRHFPETGYIPSFVSREARAEATRKATANMKAIIGLIEYEQGFPEEAEMIIDEALATSTDVETLTKAGKFYQSAGKYDKAFAAYKKIMVDVPEDTFALANMESSFKKMHGDAGNWQAQVDELNAHWKKEMLAELKKEIINIKSPDFINAVTDLQGNPLPADFLKGKIVVVDFWATWCVPCMKEMPYVHNAWNKYKDRKDVLFMIINSGSNNTLQDAQGWWGNKRYNFPVFYNKDRGIGEKLGFNVIPATYIIDKKGNIRFKTIGFEGPVVQRKIEVGIDMLQNEAE